MKANITAVLDETKIILEENKKLISEAPKGKEGNAALEAMKQEVTVIESSVNEASGMLNNSQEFMMIQDKVNAAKEKAGSMNTELKEAMEKYSKNTKTKKA